MEEAKVTFEGTGGGTYYVPWDQVQFISNDLVNTGYAGTIYLYPDDSVQSTRQNYIALQPGLYPRYYSSNSYQYTEITNAHNVEFNVIAQYFRFKEVIHCGLMFILSCFILIKLFSR